MCGLLCSIYEGLASGLFERVYHTMCSIDSPQFLQRRIHTRCGDVAMPHPLGSDSVSSFTATSLGPSRGGGAARETAKSSALAPQSSQPARPAASACSCVTSESTKAQMRVCSPQHTCLSRFLPIVYYTFSSVLRPRVVGLSPSPTLSFLRSASQRSAMTERRRNGSCKLPHGSWISWRSCSQPNGDACEHQPSGW